MKKVTFFKMHGCGNDFVIVDNRITKFEFSHKDIINISHRNYGVGCDQLIFIEKSKNADCKMVIFNPDGSKASACGNATRCVAKLIMNNSQKYVSIEVGNRILKVQNIDGQYKVNMGKPELNWQKIPLIKYFDDILNLPIKIGNLKNPSAISMGNPHLVFFVEDLYSFDASKYGKILEYHAFFPERVNVSFAKIDTKNDIEIITWERGVGITLACGSGACATFAAAYYKRFVSDQANVKSKGGSLIISIMEDEIHMQGDAILVFEGSVLVKL